MDPQSRYRKTAAGFVGGSWEQVAYGDQQQSSSEKISGSCAVHYGLSNLSSLFPTQFLKIFLNNIKYLQGTVKDVHAFVINNDLEELENKIEATSPIVLYGKDGNGLNVLHKVRRITILNNLFFFKSYDSIINRLVAWDTRRSRGTSSRNSPPLWKRRTTMGRLHCITRLQPRMMELCTICWSSTEPMKVNWITWVHEFYNYIIYKNF